ncbi:uncharacterized protein LOC117729780 isoform X2 [Cyclopterus lumpus]|uniref:uncharacterized protein LOC117729780 isoform X2 n=1 Tax=Cyclopterus lumpus TaxID=8103 RepID=UPI0014870499|nr:uncharacterized protein LOC117729780 isoform X2 [Cyclopterus lumpus]
MVDNIVSKPLGLVLIVTVHMVFNGPIPAEVTGSLGTNITFQFTFNTSVTKHFAVYTTNHTKIAEYSQGNRRKREGDFDVHPENNYVLCHITNLKLHHSGIYWATLFMDLGLPIESNNKVQLIVREENRINTVLLAAVLPLLIWCLMRTKDKQPPHEQHSSNPTVQETVEASNNVPTPPLVYSVLDFPKRSAAVLEINPSGTEYSAVSYLSEKRQV